MALGIHPEGVDPKYRIALEDLFVGGVTGELEPFREVAGAMGLDARGLSGGGIVEDFDGDGDLDVLVSSWGLLDQVHYFENDGRVRFEERTTEAGLSGISGGLNMKHADYDNDGDFDVLILRGAWLGEQGLHPNSLLQNRGDGSFVDVTAKAGMLTYHPTQTADWNDFDGDGWLDVFIGNESGGGHPHACQLFLNNRDGTFTDVARQWGVDIQEFVKGVTTGDIDNDGDPDLYLSILGRPNRLFENVGTAFKDITLSAGVSEPIDSFPAWFFDYDQDGWLDILALAYAGDMDDATNAIVAGGPRPDSPRLYRNRGDRSFEDATDDAGLRILAKTMGSNFGDIDNDGYPDFYLGTGDPDFRSLVPNRMFRNTGKGQFEDVTFAGRFGHLQKGHGVSFADIDDDGDQDVHVVIGGAFSGDVYANAVFENPGVGDNTSVRIIVSGTSSNRAGVGARVRVVLAERGSVRSVFGTVGTGGSFGANPHGLSLGTGSASRLDTLEITWPGRGGTQVFTDLPTQHRFRIEEGSASIEMAPFRR
jgi:hypothetical protein